MKWIISRQIPDSPRPQEGASDPISGLTGLCVYVVVQFYPWFKFYFPLFLGMVMYDNEFETKGNKI